MPELKTGLDVVYGIKINEVDKNLIIQAKDLAKYTQYVKHIGEKGDFLYIKDAVDWFNANATSDYAFILDSTSHLVTDTITISNNSHCLLISGFGSCETKVIAATGLINKPMFVLKSHCDMDSIGFYGNTLTNYGNSAGENCINYDTENALHVEIQNCRIAGFNIGIYDTIGTDLFLFNSIVENCIVAGVRINTTGSNAFLDCEVVTFDTCPIGIDLLKANTGSFFISNCFFIQENVGDICIKYTGGAANYAYDGIAIITNCSFNSVGEFKSGFIFDGTETPIGRDKDIIILNNQGTEDKKAHCKINVRSGNNPTTITTAGTFYKSAYVNTSSYTCKFTIANNKLTYQPKNSNDIEIAVHASIAVNQTNRVVKIAIIKNGNVALGYFGEMSVRCAVSGQPYMISTVAYLEDVKENDYFEIWVTSSTNGDQTTMDYLNLFAKSM